MVRMRKEKRREGDLSRQTGRQAGRHEYRQTDGYRHADRQMDTDL